MQKEDLQNKEIVTKTCNIFFFDIGILIYG